MTKRKIAALMFVPALILVAGCQESTAPVAPTSTRVEQKDQVPPANQKPAGGKKGVNQGVVKSPD